MKDWRQGDVGTFSKRKKKRADETDGDLTEVETHIHIYV